MGGVFNNIPEEPEGADFFVESLLAMANNHERAGVIFTRSACYQLARLIGALQQKYDGGLDERDCKSKD